VLALGSIPCKRNSDAVIFSCLPDGLERRRHDWNMMILNFGNRQFWNLSRIKGPTNVRHGAEEATDQNPRLHASIQLSSDQCQTGFGEHLDLRASFRQIDTLPDPMLPKSVAGVPFAPDSRLPHVQPDQTCMRTSYLIDRLLPPRAYPRVRARCKAAVRSYPCRLLES
jgi:hypothetical protein